MTDHTIDLTIDVTIDHIVDPTVDATTNFTIDPIRSHYRAHIRSISTSLSIPPLTSLSNPYEQLLGLTFVLANALSIDPTVDHIYYLLRSTCYSLSLTVTHTCPANV